MPVDVDAEVLWNVQLSPDYNVLALAAPEVSALARPGQFVMLKPGPHGALLLRRPYSVFEQLRDGIGRPIGLTVLSKKVGSGSALLYDAVAGTRVRCLGPLGQPFTVADPPTVALMVAGGVGLAPFAMLAEALVSRGVRASLLYGARTAAEHFCLDRFEQPSLRVVLATEDGSAGEHGRVTRPLEDELARTPADQPVQVYACGPEPMLEAVARLAAAHGRQCELAMERLMGCGMGGCYSCVVRMRDPSGATRYVRSCIDGPVLRGEDIVWES